MKDSKSFTAENSATYSFHITELALFTAIDLLARSIAKCEFVTVENRKEVQEIEYYKWNFAPNKHQTKVEFVVDLVSKLIFKNEVLIFETYDGQRLVADSFMRTKYAVIDDVFTNVTVGDWTSPRSFKTSDVIYLRYNNFALRELLGQMCESFEQIMKTAASRYKQPLEHKGKLNISGMATGTQDFEKTFDEYMNVHFRNFFKSDRAVLPLYDGYDYEEIQGALTSKTSGEVSDLTKLKDAAFEAVANVFHIPPAVIRGDASQLKDALDLLAGACDTITQTIAQGITKALYGESGYVSGNYMLIDTTYIKHIDAISSAVNIDKAIAARVLTPAKAQKYCHMLPDDSESARAYYMTKNYQNAEQSTEGGENNA